MDCKDLSFSHLKSAPKSIKLKEKKDHVIVGQQ